MVAYTLCGLHLASTCTIPGLAASESSSDLDVLVSLQEMPEWLTEAIRSRGRLWHASSYRSETGDSALTIWTLADGAYFWFRYCDGTEFVVDRAGTRVWAAWPDALTLEDAATYLLGPIWGFVLRLRGHICLHAGAVAIGDRAIALAGPPGAGKSTTTAALAKLGFPVLCDDLVPLRDEGGVFSIVPSYPCLRLWPTSVSALFGSAEALPPLTPNWDKRSLDLTANGYRFGTDPLPLAAIYVLGDRSPQIDAPLVSVLAGHAALIALIANTYSNLLPDTGTRTPALRLLGRMAARLPVRRVTPHADVAHLPALCRAILDDFHAYV